MELDFDPKVKAEGGPPPSLSIVSQSSLQQDKATKHGQTFDVHLIVKNSPFVITLALHNGTFRTFNHLAFDIALVYDVPGEPIPVTYVTTKPLEYKPSIAKNGLEISFDVKVKVLSSHHEDNFFRLQITVWDPIISSTFPKLLIHSMPVKVISKPMKPKSKRAPARTKRKADQITRPSTASNALASAATEELLQQIAAQQKETLSVVRQIASFQEGPFKRFRADEPNNHSGNGNNNNGSTLNPHFPPTSSFTSSFKSTLAAYVSLTAEEKAEQIRRVVRGLGTSEKLALEELIDLLSTSGVQVNNFPPSFQTMPVPHVHTASCPRDCNLIENTVNFNEFMDELFFSPT
eukprot:TRINITY_DN12777_c0_g1_i1.p1 TRINITY_DN12777_c0_g1~~TRINITY_DN12777_c0_g1_i1.p1  ORF type:complete len:348 (-),score=62.79 TRINITY_DN12777_c0_g1_i1:156-1199(-)